MHWWTLRQLRSGDKNARKQAVRKLGISRDTQAVQPLMEALGDPDKGVRKSAAIALGKISAGSAVNPLLSVLNNEEEERDVREAARQSILTTGSEAVQPLAKMLMDNQQSVRKLAEELLLELDASDHIVETLVEMIGNATFGEDARKAIVNRLIEIGSPVVQPLVAVLSDHDRYADALIYVTEALSGIGDIEAFKPLALLAHRMGPDIPLHGSLAKALNAIGSANHDPLVGMLRTGSECETPEDTSLVQTEAARVLGGIGGEASTQALIEALRYENKSGDHGELSIAIIESLVKIGGTKAIPVLIETLQTENLPQEICAAAAEALAMTGPSEGANALAKLLHDKSSAVRLAAAKALAMIGDSRAVGLDADRIVEDKKLNEWKAKIQNIRDALERIRYEHHQKKRQLDKMRDEYEDALIDIALGIRDASERHRLREELMALETDVSDLELTVKGLQQRERLYLNTVRSPVYARY